MNKIFALIAAAASLVSGVALLQTSPVNEVLSRATGEHHGQATFFFQDSEIGACGQAHSDSDFIVSLQPEEYANGTHCGKTIAITDSNSGKTMNGVVADECPGCGAKDNIDLSVGLFTQFEDLSVGVFPVVWVFVD
ncbi:hypothetical protein Clacol_003513 [Clathrus columnatus]|uniref:RlpA-like double-psi beta-barrel-protein domain-containing protein-containing protein n=1 Tax=Clathrus columnatus TaxID=1419009 RepID=A0AAV5A9S3_9AGAM|nr:hypothetical protein Clacol_003513 [Clathrus columnatus]